MTKQVLYTYLGTNGTLTTPIHLEGIYSVKKIILIADKGKKLTCGDANLYDRITLKNEDEELLWEEVSGQN